ncbi:MAG: substrate-binding domain-containing protein [Dethiobacteria bacterium]
MFKIGKGRNCLSVLASAALILMLLFSLLMGAGCSQEAVVPEAGGENGEEIGAEGGAGEDEFIILSTTTSTYDSGLLDYLLPVFKEKTGIEVRVVSQGTGQALETGKRGDADVLLVHDRAAELELVEEGFFTDRHDVCYNDFIILGAPEDPANVKEADNAVEVLSRIAENEEIFISRGDDSGTHRRELATWDEAGISERGEWYKSIGQGMADTLRMADELHGYTMSDRGTYLSLKDTLDLEILFEGDPVLFNQYGVMAVSSEKHPHIKYEQAKKFVDFLVSDEGQEMIASFKIGDDPLFFPGKGVE